MDDERLVDLEIRLAYQDRKVEELDQLVRSLVTRLETTERELAEVKREITPQPHTNERPPHY